MATLPIWAWLLIVWWCGMIPAAALAGDQERRAGKEQNPTAKIIFVAGWPIVLMVAPMVWAFVVSKRGKPGGKPKQ